MLSKKIKGNQILFIDEIVFKIVSYINDSITLSKEYKEK